MKISLLAALGAAGIATLVSSVASAATKTIDFGLGALAGNPGISFSGGATLDQSTALDLGGSTVIVERLGANDSSGLAVFSAISTPGTTDTFNIAPSKIDYGTNPGSLGTDIVKSWSANGDTFTEKLDQVLSINRATQNAITVVLSGTLTDTSGAFNGAAAFLILQANQAANAGAISVAFTNTTTLGTPEPSTWVMMALGFGALGYAAARKGKVKIATLSA